MLEPEWLEEILENGQSGLIVEWKNLIKTKAIPL